MTEQNNGVYYGLAEGDRELTSHLLYEYYLEGLSLNHHVLVQNDEQFELYKREYGTSLKLKAIVVDQNYSRWQEVVEVSKESHVIFIYNGKDPKPADNGRVIYVNRTENLGSVPSMLKKILYPPQNNQSV